MWLNRCNKGAGGEQSSSSSGGSGSGSNSNTGGSSSRGSGFGDDEPTKWRVNAGRYEELTWTHGGLYEAFQALADPRRVVFSMGVVDDGAPHEGGEGVDGLQDVSPIVVQGLLGLSVQQVGREGGREAGGKKEEEHLRVFLLVSY